MNNVVLHEGDYTTHTKLAVWFGNEFRGISELAIQHSEMCKHSHVWHGRKQNLGITSGIVLYEVTKQRREYQSRYKRSGKRREIDALQSTLMSKTSLRSASYQRCL